ncbi:MAG: hypothetical protein HC829_03980 [Bacteroidales bacterium]|nr:hypothetical protein [Bacteroidales bacterium]
MATVRGVVETDRPGLRVVITDDWNPDRYVHFAIVQAGFRAQELADIEPACAAIAEPFARGAQRLLHVRIHQSYLKDSNALNRARFETIARPCLEAVVPVETVLVTREHTLRLMRGEADVTTLWPVKANGRLADLLQRGFPGKEPPITAVVVDAEVLDQMSRAYAALEAETRQRLAALGAPAHTVAEGIAATRRIIPFPKDE